MIGLIIIPFIYQAMINKRQTSFLKKAHDGLALQLSKCIKEACIFK